MAKKRAKKTSKKKTTTKKKKKSENISKTIAENLVELQKVHVDLADKFDNLSKQISSLLELFENAAKTFSEHPAIKASEKDKEFLNKIDKLLEQNKTIAKGLTLMEGKIKERVYGSPMNPQQRQPIDSESISLPHTGRPLPRF